jgi:hypothetical protein
MESWNCYQLENVSFCTYMYCELPQPMLKSPWMWQLAEIKHCMDYRKLGSTPRPITMPVAVRGIK